MVSKKRPKKEPTRIRDARGREVSQLDPIELHLLRRHDVVDAEALRPIVDEVGSGLEERTRRFVPILVVGVSIIAVALAVQIIVYSIQGDVLRIFSARNIALANVWLLVLTYWTWAKQTRFGRIRKIMLKHRRCPHCGYDLHGLGVDDADGHTVCPECGCAWNIDVTDDARGDE